MLKRAVYLLLLSSLPPLMLGTPIIIENDVVSASSSSMDSNKSQKDTIEVPRWSLRFADCAEIRYFGFNKSGVYTIWPRSKDTEPKPIQVYCDMETDGGGWIIIQRRGNFLRPNDYFFKDWNSYKRGFGDIERDFWLGNDNIFTLTNQGPYSIRFDLTDIEGEHRYALYDYFRITDEVGKYRLSISDYSGTAGDSMIATHNGEKFSTKDQDNDNDTTNCVENFKGAWWHKKCHRANLNGLYLRGKHESFADGVIWHDWKGYHESLDKTEMKVRPKDFRRTL